MKEYTDLFPEGTSTVCFLKGLWPFRKQTVEVPSGNKSVYSFTKTHDIQFIMSVAASDWLKEFICWEQINCLFRVLGGIPGLPQNDVTSRGNKHGANS